MHIGDDKDGVYCCIHTPLVGGVLGQETIRLMEKIVLLILKEVIGSLEQLSVGVMPRIRDDILDAITSEMLTQVKRPEEKKGKGKKIVNIVEIKGN